MKNPSGQPKQKKDWFYLPKDEGKHVNEWTFDPTDPECQEAWHGPWTYDKYGRIVPYYPTLEEIFPPQDPNMEWYNYYLLRGILTLRLETADAVRYAIAESRKRGERTPKRILESLNSLDRAA